MQPGGRLLRALSRRPVATREAEPLLRSALEAYEKSLGEEHPQVGGFGREG